MQYNISPDFGTTLAVGETIEITGKMYSRDLKRYGVIAEAGVALGSNGFISSAREIGRVEKSCSRGGSAAFTISCAVTQQLADLSSERGFRAYISFLLIDSEDFSGGASTCPQAEQQLSLLQYRLDPVISSVTTGDESGALMHFGGAVQGRSDLYMLVKATLDPLDETLTIASAEITLGENILRLDAASISGNRLNIGVPEFNGEFASYTLCITDSKGNSGSFTGGAFRVYPYYAPRLEALADAEPAERYELTTGDEGQEQAVLSDAGSYLWVNLSADVCAIAGKNTWTLQRAYAEYGESLSAAETALSGTEGEAFTLRKNMDIFPRSIAFAAEKRHSVQLVLQDYFGSAVISCDVDKAGGYFNIEKYGVAAGMRSTAAEADEKFESAYPVYPYAGIRRCDGAAYEIPLELDEGGKFSAYSDQSGLRLRCFGNVVQLTGELTPTASISGSISEHVIAALPAEYAPACNVTAICQGTAAALWLLRAYPASDENYPAQITFSRYRSGASYASCAAGNWLPVNVLWIAGGAYAAEDAEKTIVRPAAAMTANSSQGCVATASSVYSSSYAPYKAFDKSFSNQYGWASARGEANEWIQLKMDVALKKISVSIINRNYEYVYGPQSGTILGSNDGENWVEIGAFEGRNGDTSGFKSVHECSNADEAYSYVRINCLRESGTLIAVGEIYIEGVENAAASVLGEAVLGSMILGQ